MVTETYEDADGVDSEVDTSAFEQDPVLAEYQTAEEAEFWREELVASRKERQDFNKHGITTINRYADERDAQNVNAARFNIFYSNTDIKQASLYARTPAPSIKRRFNDATDQVSRVASNLVQRNLVYELDCELFDNTFRNILFDRLVPGIGIGWSRFDQEEGEYDYAPAPTNIDGSQVMDEQGQPIPGEPIEGSHIKDQYSPIDHVAWDDFLWAPCRLWADCRWVGRRVPMSKGAIKARFEHTASKETLVNLTYTKQTEADLASKGDSMRPKNSTQPTVDVFELWDKERKLVFWIAESADVPLDVQADTNEFEGFFPTPLPPLGRFTTTTTTPISDFSLARNLYDELDRLNQRAANLINMLKVRFVYDSSNEELKNLYTTVSEGEGFPVKDWAVSMSEKGGIRGSMEFAPLQEIASTYRQLVEDRERVKSQIMEIEGISDFQRGVQQPYVTAAAATATGQASTTRMTLQQLDVARYIERLLRLKAHLICKFYKPETILARAGSLPQADMQYVPQALQLLKDEQFRQFRLEVSVDSIQMVNEGKNKAEMAQFGQTMIGIMQQMLPAAQTMPQILPLGLQFLRENAALYSCARDFEGTLDAMLQQFATQTAQEKAQPPKPTPQEVKAQTAQQQMAVDAQKSQAQEETKRMIAQLQAQLDAQKLQIDAMNAQTAAKKVDAAIDRDRAHTQLDVIDAAHSNAMDRVGLGAL